MPAIDQLLAEELEQCLISTQGVLNGLSGSSSLERADLAEQQWIVRQLETLRKYLAALTADMEAGLSLAELGFESPIDLQETIQDIARQVAQLQARFRALQLGRAR